MDRLIKKKSVDTYRIGVQTVSKDSVVELPSGAIPLAVNMRMPVLSKNPVTGSFDMGNIDVVIYAQKVKDKNKIKK